MSCYRVSRRCCSGGEGPGGGGHGEGERHRGGRGPGLSGPPSLRQSTLSSLWGQHPSQQWTSLRLGHCRQWHLAGEVRPCGVTPTPNIQLTQRRRWPTSVATLAREFRGVCKRKWNSEHALIFAACVLRKSPGIIWARDITSLSAMDGRDHPLLN